LNQKKDGHITSPAEMGGFEAKNVRAQVEVAEEKSPKVVLIYHG